MPRRPSGSKAATLHALRVELEEIRPPVYRELVVRSDVTLAKLHEILQAAFGWGEAHLHVFETEEGEYSDPQSDPEPGEQDERKARLSDVLPHEGASLTYVYDFGDDWRHRVEVRAITPLEPGAKAPSAVLVGGARAAPPEDCGGVPGYEDLCAAMASRRHPQRAELIEWLGGEPFDPEAFDPVRIEARLRAVR